MASSHVTSGEASPLAEGEHDQLLALQPLQHQEGLFHKVWTISSERKIETLCLNLPGVVFIVHDATLDSPSTSTLPPSTDDPESEASIEGEAQTVDSRVVEKIVVTSDSIELLESSILTQVLVSDKNQLREFYGRTAEYVLGGAVLVRDDPTAAVEVSVFNSASLYLSSKEGFSLRSFDATVDGTGIYQLQVPSIHVQEHLSVAAMGLGTMALSANTIAADVVIPMTLGKYGDVFVHSSNLRANTMYSTVGYRGRITFAGGGEVAKQRAVILASGEINTGNIESEKTEVFINWSGRAVVSALKELDATSLFFGSVEYTKAEPDGIIERSWLWWTKDKGPLEIVAPAAIDSISNASRSYEFRAPPLRQPVPIHYHVKRSRRGEPVLVKPTATRHSKMGLLTGLVAVGTIIAIASRRKAAQPVSPNPK